MAVEMGAWPRVEGLCGDKTDHNPHRVEWSTVAQAGFWCHADQTKRMPWAGEQARKHAA